MKKTITYLAVMFVLIQGVFAQTITTSISGTLINSYSNVPIPNQAVYIVADTSNSPFSFIDTVFTDANGYYSDGLTIPDSPPITFYISTSDCNGAMVTQTVISSTLPMVSDFSISCATYSCTAFFSVYHDSLIPGPTYTFNDLSNPAGGIVTGWLWDFGDGNFSSLQHPTHTYAMSFLGMRQVCLTISTSLGCTSINCIFLTVDTTGNVPCQASYQYTVNNNTVDFYGFQNNVNDTYYWDFGDSTSSTVQNPIHTYSGPGIYNVCMFISNTNGCSPVNCANIVIGNPNVCPALFYSYIDSTNYLQFHFLNASTTLPFATWLSWNFGDGTTSTDPNPTHTFANMSTYQVCLDVMDTIGNVYCSYCENINTDTTNSGSCSAFFQYSTNFMDVSFNGYASDPGSTYSWDFGDNSAISTQQNPVHSYAAYADYNVCLTISSTTGCTNTYCTNVTVPCPASFTVMVDTLNYLQYNFANTSVLPGNQTYAWDFGDGSTSTLQNPSHVYAGLGNYNVCLNVYDNMSNLLCSSCQTVSISGCQAYFTYVVIGNAIYFDGNLYSIFYTQFAWDFGDGHTSTLEDPIHYVSGSGSYYVCLTATTYNGCTSSYCTTINVNILPSTCTAYYTYNQSGSPYNYLFSDSSTTIVSGATVNSWNWIISDSLQNTLFTSNLQNPSFTFPSDGLYDVCLWMMTDSGCVDSLCTIIYVQDTIPVNCLLNVSSIVSSVTVTGGNDGYIDLTVSGGVPPYTFGWSNGNSSEDIFGLTSGTYIVTISQGGGNCPVTSDTFHIVEPYLGIPIDTLYSQTIDSCLNFVPDSFWVANISVLDSMVTVTWVITGGGITDTFHVNYIFGNYGNYVVVLTINCAKSMVSYMAHINIASYLGIADEPFQKFCIYPNPFTGSFNLKLPPGLSKADIRIYNYMGQIIYIMKTYDANSSIDASQWSKGVYFIRVSSGNNQFMTSKIIKK